MEIASTDSTLNIHVYPSNLTNESRIFKIAGSITTLGIFKQVTVIGKYEEQLKEVESLSDQVKLVRVRPWLGQLRGTLFRPLKVLSWYLKSLLYIAKSRPTCINAHSLPVLPLCVVAKLFTGAFLVYDTHELETEVMRSRGFFRVLYKTTESFFIRFCDEVCTVNQEIADWYRRRYNLQRVWAVENVPNISLDAPPASGMLRSKLGIPDNDLVFLYQGLLSNGRGIQKLIEAFESFSQDKHLVFMGYGPLREIIREASKIGTNIHFHEAVPVELLPNFTADADVGLALIENTCLSYYYSLPNKVYEYMAAGKPVIASAFPVMKRVVESADCGWSVPPETEAIMNLVQGLTRAEIERKSENALTARKSIGWRYQEPQIVGLYNKLLKKEPSSSRIGR